MDLISSVIAIVAAGAASALKETAGKAVKDAYEGLKTFLAGKLHSFQNFEEDPKDEDFRKAIAKEIQKKALTDDPDLLQRVHDLEAALEKEPPAQLETLGIDLTNIRAAKDIIIKELNAGAGRLRVKDVQSATGQVLIEGLNAGVGAAGPKN
jgi:hypothetical protein